jgi:hypothetical protein
LSNGQRGGEGSWTRANVTVTNNGPNIANLVRVRIVPENGDSRGTSDPAPIFFSDNYLVLRVGEVRNVIAEFPDSIFRGQSPDVIWTFAV